MPHLPGEILAGLAADVEVKQFREEGVTQLVTAATVNADAQVILATDVGVLDERISYQQFMTWISSDTGALLEVSADGLRVSSAALGPGLKGGGAAVIEPDINGLVAKTGVVDADELMLYDSVSGLLRKVTRTEYLAGTSTGTNLGNTPTATDVLVTSSSGSDTTIAAANTTTAGVFTASLWNKLAGIQDGATQSDLGRTLGAADITITNTGGTDATLPLATSSTTGIWGPTAVDVVTTTHIVNLAVTTDKLADSSVATAKIQDLAVDSGKLADNAVATAKIQDDAVATAKIPDKAVTLAKQADAAANSLRGNPGASATPKDIVAGDLTTVSPGAGDKIIGFQSGGALVEYDASGLVGNTNLTVTRDTLTVTYNSSTGTTEAIEQATGALAGILPAKSALPSAELGINDSVVGFDQAGVLTDFSVTSADPTTLINATAHGLTAADVGKPLFNAQLLDDTDTAQYFSAVLAAVVDVDNIRVYDGGSGLTFSGPDTLLDSTDIATVGRYFYWDLDSVAGGRYVNAKPSDSSPKLPELIEVLDASGGQFLARIRDLGPPGETIVIENPTGNAVEEIELSASDLSGTAPADRKFGINQTTSKLFSVSGGNWKTEITDRQWEADQLGNQQTTIVLDMSTGYANKGFTLTGDATISLTPPSHSTTRWVFARQNGTGGHSLSLPATVIGSEAFWCGQAPNQLTVFRLDFDQVSGRWALHQQGRGVGINDAGSPTVPITLDFSAGEYDDQQIYLLTPSLEISDIKSHYDGKEFAAVFIQDGIGGRLLNWTASNIRWVNPAIPWQPSPVANSTSILKLYRQSNTFFHLES